MCPSGGGKTGFFHYLPSCSVVDPLSTPSEVPIPTLGGSGMLSEDVSSKHHSLAAGHALEIQRNETVQCFHLASRVPTPILSCFLLGWLCPGCAVSIGLCGLRICITSTSQLEVGEATSRAHTCVSGLSPSLT